MESVYDRTWQQVMKLDHTYLIKVKCDHSFVPSKVFCNLIATFKSAQNTGSDHDPDILYTFVPLAINCSIQHHPTWCSFMKISYGQATEVVCDKIKLKAKSSFKVREVPRMELPLYIGMKTTDMFIKKLNGE